MLVYPSSVTSHIRRDSLYVYQQDVDLTSELYTGFTRKGKDLVKVVCFWSLQWLTVSCGALSPNNFPSQETVWAMVQYHNIYNSDSDSDEGPFSESLIYQNFKETFSATFVIVLLYSLVFTLKGHFIRYTYVSSCLCAQLAIKSSMRQVGCKPLFDQIYLIKWPNCVFCLSNLVTKANKCSDKSFGAVNQPCLKMWIKQWLSY